MPGLYKDSFDKAIETGLESIKMNPDMVRIYPTLVIKDTKLEKLYKECLYKPLSLDEAIEISSRLYMIYSYKKIPVIRIGLQPTENINKKKDVVAGPFHPSIRQLVETNIHKIYLEELINKYGLKNKIKIHISNREISIIAGNKKANKNYFYKKYGLVINFENDENNFIEYEDKKIFYDIENFMREFVEKTYGGDLY